MLRSMDAPRPQPIAPPPPEVVVVVAEPRHAFGLPEVREIPQRPAGGPWEAGW
jgi:hypothetical protein